MTIGYDSYHPNQSAVLDLQLRDGASSLAHDFSKSHVAGATLTGAPVWTFLGNGLPYLEFNPANPDNIIVAALDSTELNFTSGAFSGAAWIYPNAYGNRWLMMKGAAETGWGLWLSATSPYLQFTTEQAGPTYQSTGGGASLALNAWQFVAFTRSGAVGRVYLNGIDATTVSATHVNPASAAAGAFYIGTTVGGGAGWYDGSLWRPRVWKCQLAAADIMALYHRERGLFGV